MATRRELLAVAGAAGAAATAGCLGGLGGDEDDDGTAEGAQETEGTPSDDGESGEDVDVVRLEDLSVQNNHDEDHRVQVAVDADGEMLHLGTYDLEGDGDSTTIAGEWEDDAASYRVHARLDDGDIMTEDVTDGVGSETSCTRALVRVDSEGGLAVWVGSGCSE